MVVPEQCTKSSVLTVVRRLKFLSSQQKVDQFTAGTVTKSIEGTRSPLKGGLDSLSLIFFLNALCATRVLRRFLGLARIRFLVHTRCIVMRTPSVFVRDLLSSCVKPE